MEQAAEQAASLRANESLVERLTNEAGYEYTSKSRLRVIAISALRTLQALYGQAAVEAEAEQAAARGVIIAPEGIAAP